MPGISIHVVDVATGTVATGMEVALFRVDGQARQLIARGKVDTRGVLAEPALDRTFDAGYFEAVFEVARFYEGRLPAPATPFLDVVTYRFGIAQPQQHYHLPMKVTPWGYSCFRGGA